MEYIHEKYGNPPANVDAIVDPDTRGFVFALIISNKLRLPYIPIQKAGAIAVGQDDVIQATYKNRKNKVDVFLKSCIIHWLAP